MRIISLKYQRFPLFEIADSLGGNSKTVMVANICPTNKNIDETLCTLQFAQRVRRIELGQARKNVQMKVS